MNRVYALLLVAGSAVACGQIDAPASVGGRSEVQTTTSAANNSPLAGYDAYAQACASCHETGSNGAPVTGNPDDWVGRSPHWQAVLMEHANQGYLNMPAKGGHLELSRRTVNLAAEYMLSRTFPDRPPD